MEPTELDPLLAERIRDQLHRAGIDASYLAFVARHLDAPDAGWRWCCGSQCDPCVERLGQVVDAVRRSLGGPPPRPLGAG